MSRTTLRREGKFWVLEFHSNPKKNGGGFENNFNPEFVAELNAALDKVEKESAGTDCALITTSSGKVYSSGLDLGFLMGPTADSEAQMAFMQSFYGILHRFLTFPLPTVAALNGHAFAGGFLLALAHDYRVMNSEKGFCCMTEVDINFALTEPLNFLIKEKMPRRLAANIMLEACKLNAAQLLEEKVIEAAVPPADLMSAALGIAERVSSKGQSAVYQAIKTDIYCDAAASLEAASKPSPPSKL